VESSLTLRNASFIPSRILREPSCNFSFVLEHYYRNKREPVDIACLDLVRTILTALAVKSSETCIFNPERQCGIPIGRKKLYG
jgi:hypothetical protein